MVKETVLHAEIYRRGVAVLQGTEEELKQYFAEHNLDVAQVTDVDWENTEGMCCDDGSDVFVYSVKPMDLYTLIHELSHATFKILEIVGISPTLAEEAYTYLFEHLVRQFTSSDDVQLQSLTCES